MEFQCKAGMVKIHVFFWIPLKSQNHSLKVYRLDGMAPDPPDLLAERQVPIKAKRHLGKSKCYEVIQLLFNFFKN